MIDVYWRGNVIGAYFRDVNIVYIERASGYAEPAVVVEPTYCEALGLPEQPFQKQHRAVAMGRFRVTSP